MMYDVLASYYDALVEDAQARDAWIELIEANIRGRSILDAACGSGDIAIELARRGYAVTAFDCSEQMLRCDRTGLLTLSDPVRHPALIVRCCLETGKCAGF